MANGMHGLAVGRAPGKLSRAAPGALEQHREPASDTRAIEGRLLGAEQGLHLLEPRRFNLIGNLIRHCRRRGSRTGREFERIGLREHDVSDQFERAGKIFIALAGETDNDVGGKCNVRARRADAPHQLQIVVARVPALHGRQNPVRTGLEWQMQIGHQFFLIPMQGDEILAHIAGMAGGIAQPRDIGNLRQPPQQPRQ